VILQIKNRSFPEIVGRFHLQIGAEKWNCPIRGCHFLENWFVKTCRIVAIFLSGWGSGAGLPAREGTGVRLT